MGAQKACKLCRAIVEGNKCEVCGASELIDSFKGRVVVINPEQSEIAKNLKITRKGSYAIKVK